MLDQPISFEAIGTKWWMSIDGDEWAPELVRRIAEHCEKFDQRFSRFIADSELSQLNARLAGKAAAGELLSPELFAMLAPAEKLMNVTGGAFDPNVSALLRGYGYDSQYSFERDEELLSRPRGSWRLVAPNGLQTRGNVEFDTGGIGKGVLIDEIAGMLRAADHQHFLVDGGGDMYGSSKSDGSPWTIALQHPFDPQQAVGTVQLLNQGFAASASTHRQVGDFHHILNPQTGKPVDNVVAVFCTGSSAQNADLAATALFVSKQECWADVQKLMKVEYMVIQPNLKYDVSSHFVKL